MTNTRLERQFSRDIEGVTMMGLPTWLAFTLVIALPMLVAGIYLAVRITGARMVKSDHPTGS